MAEEDLVDREWTYAGQWRTSKGLGHRWFDHDDAERVFDKMKGSVVGGVYTIRCTPDGTRAVTDTTYTGRKIDDEERLLELAAAARTEGVLIERERMEKSDKRSDEFREAVAPLKVLLAKQIGWGRRSAFIAAVIEELSR